MVDLQSCASTPYFDNVNDQQIFEIVIMNQLLSVFPLKLELGTRFSLMYSDPFSEAWHPQVAQS
jgi:hypothetical protein